MLSSAMPVLDWTRRVRQTVSRCGKIGVGVFGLVIRKVVVQMSSEDIMRDPS
jgi:hypothetical protein